MPSSPKGNAKSFYPRAPSSSASLSLTLRSVLLVLLLLIALTALVIGLVALSRPARGYDCNFKPRSVSVVWERAHISSGGADGGGANGIVLAGGGDGEKRHKVMGFVGIFTGFGSVDRRRALRQTWPPSDRQGVERLEEATGLAFRLAFLKAAYALFDTEFYVKADDDIYLRPDRLAFLLAKERSNPQTYIGCMKKGPVFTDPKLKWYEPQSHLLGNEYFLHAYGPIYALSSSVVRSLVALRNDSFRMLSNEDTTIGSWMLAMNVNHENSHALCEPQCTPSSIAVWDIPKCSGLCNPEKMLELHKVDICSKSPTFQPDE